ncbi:uncharacterized protein [Procambarus clarkii]|uniref:uncharacterized protein isoform X2 n=1 Tax=Procambarus clarkii TaxID=6728 RepID=UPI001E675FDC|nr:uncharacterized protein LOC123757494 isoform X2 [Procambarus clarkii]
MFVHVIAVFILLSVITAGEGRCEPPRRGQHLHYNVRSVPDFRLWLKMEEKNTQFKASLVVSPITDPVTKFQTFVWSNTDVYTGFPNKHIKKELGVAGKDIVSVNIITANASMEWIFCTNAFTFPVMPASNNTVVTVLVVMVVVLVVVLAAAGAYIHRLRNSLNQYNGVHLPKCDRQVYPAAAPPSSRSGPPLQDGLQENIYEEWQERPAVAAASHHSSTNSIYGLVVNLPQEHTP